MFLKLNLFKALIKKEWQGAGLVVGNDGEGIYLTGMKNGYWSIYLEEYLMTKKAKAAIIELIGAIPLPGNAANFWKNEEDQWEELDLLQKTIYKPDITYFKTQYIDTGVRICDYGRGAAVLQNMNTLECNMLPENIVSMVDSGSREKGEGMISPPLSHCDYGRGAAVLQNMNTLECNMLPENIVSMVDSGSREKGEGMISPPLSQGKEIYWQNEACTLNTLECNMLPENIVSMVDSGSREKGEGMISPPLSQGKEIYWQNEACTLRCGTFKPREGTKEQFILWEMEKYDFSEKQQK